MKIIKLAFKNIISKPLNLLLSIILFALGVGLINFLLLFQDQLQKKFEANLAGLDLVIGAKGSPLQLILCNMYHIDNPTGNIAIKDARPFLNPKHPLVKASIPLSLGDNYKSFRIVGTTHNILDLYKGKIGEGKLYGKDLEVTIGKQVADEANLKIGDKFVSSHGFDEDDDLAHDHAKFVVVGIMASSGTVLDQLILTTTSSIWAVHEHEAETSDTTVEGHDHHDHADIITNEALLAHPEQSITSILVQYKSKTNYQALNMPRAINENTAMQAASPAYEINKLFDLIGVGTNGLKAIALLIGLVSAMSIFISLYKSLKERKYELALIRVMGGKRSSIFALIIVEGLVLALIGWAIGTLLSHIGIEVLAQYLKSDFRYSFTGWKWLSVEWLLLLGSLLLGLISALIPAYKASKTDIQQTLSER
jgi:putative ABC transport system permease protein